jgi:hypothetical protein
MLIDNDVINSGSLFEDLTPPIIPVKELVDKLDRKPENWDDRKKISDPYATKPIDWDENEPEFIFDINSVKPEGWLVNEPKKIPDAGATKPEDWDDENDGEWEAAKIDNPVCVSAPGCGPWTAPLIKNPKYKGIWKAPLIANQNYQGVWKPRMVPNPEYFEEKNLFSKLLSFDSIGLELWSISNNVYFDNFIITNNESVAARFALDSWSIKNKFEIPYFDYHNLHNKNKDKAPSNFDFVGSDDLVKEVIFKNEL